MTTTVTALLVSHDGARWLPAVLDGLLGQSRAVDRAVAVDTGSSDDSRTLLGERLSARFGADAVQVAPARSSYGAAVATGLAALPAADPGADEWVWLLHDDSNPAPTALQVLLDAAAQNPSVDILGPKLREWPSLRRLLEVGVTISGTGRRETGLERGEYDQGQHDQTHDTLAVNTAGMLVRRTVLEKLGFDDALPVFGNDLDFGWRAARAGHRTLAVPDAVVFHVEAAHRGVRRTPVTGSYRRQERRAALYTLLVNCSALALPFVAVRLVLGSLVRALGLLLVRAPGEALDELVGLLAVYARPDRVLRGRLRRRRTATVPPRQVRPLLAPPWVPYRHGLDFLGDLALAVAHSASDVSARRRAAAETAETGPVAEEAENLPAETGLLARLVSSRTAALFVVLLVLAAVGARGLVGPGMLSGGALLPAPESAIDWWRLYLASTSDAGVPSLAPAAPYLLPFALLGTLLLGKAWLVVDLLFLLAVPLSAWGAHRFLRLLTGSGSASLWGATAYGLLPVLSGAVQQGRLGTVAALVVLPWVAHAGYFLRHTDALGGPDADRRWRAAWRTSLWLAVLVAFVPLAWPVAAVLTVLAVVGGLVRAPREWARSSAWAPVVVPVLAAAVLLLPWSWSAWAEHGPAAILFEAGLPAPELVGELTSWGVALGRPGGPGAAPAWLSAGIVLAAVAALVRTDTRTTVARAWVVVVAGLALTAVLAGGSFALASSPVEQPVWLGFPLLLAQAAGICAASVAATGVRDRLTGISFGWRQPVGVAVVLVAALTPLAGLGWWALNGTGGPLDRTEATDVPTYMTDVTAADPRSGILEIRGSQADGFDYVVLRGPGVRLGEDSLRPAIEDQRPLTELVSRLVTVPQPEDIRRLSTYGVEFVYLPRPADGQAVGNLDSLSGVTPGSATRPGARAWQLDTDPSEPDAADTGDAGLRPWLLGLQGLALLAAAVLAAPTRKVRR